MKKINNIFIFVVLFFGGKILFGIPDYFWEPFPQVFSSGMGATGTARVEDIRFSGRNPASIAGLKHDLLMFEKRTTFEDSPIGTDVSSYSANYIGMAFLLPVWNFSSGILFQQEKGDENFHISGGSILAARAFGKYKIGVGFSHYGYIPGILESRYIWDLGLIYHVKNNSKNFFAFHEFGFGGRWRIDYLIDANSQESFSIGMTPGFSILFLKNSWFESRFQLDLPFSRDFREFPSYYGAEIILLKRISFVGGFSGNDFFTSENLHLGFGVNIVFDEWYSDVSVTSKAHRASANKFNVKPYFEIIAGYDRYYDENYFIEDDKYLLDYLLTPDSDGINDFVDLKLPVDSIGELKDWQIQIFDNNYKLVFSIENKFLDAKTIDQPPKNIIWDGSGINKFPVDDGEYIGFLYALQSNGVVTKYRIARINVKSIETSVSLEVNPSIMDIKERVAAIKIELEADNEEIKEIYVAIKDVNEEIFFTETCLDLINSCKFQWFPHSRKDIHPGEFSVEVFILDKSDAKKKVLERKISITNSDFPLKLSIDKSVVSEESIKKSGVTLSLLAPVHLINSSVLIRFSDSSGSIFSDYNFKLKSISKLNWLGKGVQPRFTGKVFVSIYENGKLSEIALASSEFFIDSTPPVITLGVVPEIGFTPGFKRANQLFINSKIQDESEIIGSTLRLKDEFGTVLWTNTVNKRFNPQEQWNGMYQNKSIISGTTAYFIELECQDEAGNIGKSNIVKIFTGPILEEIPRHTKVIRTISDQGHIVELKRRDAYKLQLNNLYFLPDKSILTTLSKQEFLKEIAPILKDLKNFKFIVEGHVNPVGTPRAWQKLSEDRANQVKRLLSYGGIPEENITAIGRGGRIPVVLTKNQQETVFNRRVEILVYRENLEISELKHLNE